MSYQKRIEESKQKVYKKAIATKILDLMDKLRLSGSSLDSRRRWIWELMQNAKDVKNTVKECVDISVELIERNESEGSLIFKHNGRCFSPENITFLIEQVSTKERSNENYEETTGKFGTGFLTTHLLSEIVKVHGVVKDDDLPYRKFCITLDRSGRTVEDVIKSVEKSLEELGALDSVEDYNNYDENEFNTIFVYDLNNKGLETASIGLDDLEQTLPLTLVFLPSIDTVEVRRRGNENLYQATRQELSSIEVDDVDAYIVKVEKVGNASDKAWEFIHLKAQNFEIALPIDSTNPKISLVKDGKQNIPRLFCDFPLIGTEKIGIPFFLNSSHFYPTEPRDGIWLSDHDEPRIDQNKAIFIAAVDCYAQLINHAVSHDWDKLYCLAMITSTPKFDWLSHDWYTGNVIKRLVSVVYSAQLVQIVQGKEKVFLLKEEDNNSYYCVDVPFDKQPHIRARIWDLAKEVGIFCTPIEPDFHHWYEVVKDKVFDKRLHLTVESLSKFIVDYNKNLQDLSSAKHFNISDPISWLNRYFNLLLEAQINSIEFLKNYKIIPNQNGDLCSTSDKLHFDPGIEEPLKDIGRLTGRDYRAELANTSLSIANLLPELSQSNVVEEINKFLGQKNVEPEAKVRVCHVLTSLFPKEPESMAPLLHEKRSLIYNLSQKLFPSDTPEKQLIANWSEEIWKISDRMQVEFLVRKVSDFQELSYLSQSLSEGTEETCNWLFQFIKLIVELEWQDILDKENTPVIPNQHGVFYTLNFLFGEQEAIDETLKNVAAELGKDFREELVHLDCGLNHLIPQSRQKSQAEVVREINELLKRKDIRSEIKRNACCVLSSLFPGEGDTDTALFDKRSLIYNLSQKLFPSDTPEKQLIANWSEEIWEVSDKMQVEFLAQKIAGFKNLVSLSSFLSESLENTCIWLSQFIALLVKSEQQNLLKDAKTPIIPNQNDPFSFCVIKNLSIEEEFIDERLKDIAASLGKDFREELAYAKLDYSIFEELIGEKKLISQDDIGEKIEDLVKSKMQELPRQPETQKVFDELVLWINENSDSAKTVFKDLSNNIHRLYDDAIIAENMRQIPQLKKKIDELEARFKELEEENQKLKQLQVFQRPSQIDSSDVKRLFTEGEDRDTTLSGTVKFPNPKLILDRILIWWKEHRDSLVRKYEEITYPDPDNLLVKNSYRSDDAETVKRWITLFMLGALHTMGRSNSEQHCEFLRCCEDWGWFEVTNKAEESAWTKLLARYFEMPTASERLSYYQWIRYYPAFYAFSRWCYQYRDSLLSSNKQGTQLSFSSLFNPHLNPIFQGTGQGDAPPADSLLGIGAVFVVRELMRAGILTNPGMRRYAYLPTRRIRELFYAIGCQEILDSKGITDNSSCIYEFLVHHLGEEDAIFCGDYDLPFLMLQREPEEHQQKILGVDYQRDLELPDDSEIV